MLGIVSLSKTPHQATWMPLLSAPFTHTLLAKPSLCEAFRNAGFLGYL